jgi:hypothetical protein
MKLYVWDDFFHGGIAVVLAEDVEQARRLLKQRAEQQLGFHQQPGDDDDYWPWSDIDKGPTRTLDPTEPVAFFMNGG